MGFARKRARMGVCGARTPLARTARADALATVAEDLAGGDGAPGLDALVRSLVARAGLSDSALVCALVYLGRIDAGVCTGLTLGRGNVAQLLVASLAVASAYVDPDLPARVDARFGPAVGLPASAVAGLRNALVQALKGQTYISLAAFREFDDILDTVADFSGVDAGVDAPVERRAGSAGASGD